MNRPGLLFGLLDLRLLFHRSRVASLLLGLCLVVVAIVIASLARQPPTNGTTPAIDDGQLAALRTFHSLLIKPSAIDAVEQQILDGAAAHQLEVGRIDHEQETDRAAHFTVISLRFPVSGRYRDLRAFIETALAREPALSMRHLRIELDTSGAAAEGARLRADLTLQLLLGEQVAR